MVPPYTRAKKKQLIEERHHAVANDNRKLMEKMTAIMTEVRKFDKPVRIISKTERERRRFAERVNKENKALAKRLEQMSPMVDGKKFEKDFSQHCKLVESIKHKRYSMASTSLSRKNESGTVPDPWGPTFDADSYLSQRLSRSRDLTQSSSILGAGTPDPADSPIRTMADFRRSVITKRRTPNGPLPALDRSSGSMSAPIKFEGLSADVRFELSHEPKE